MKVLVYFQSKNDTDIFEGARLRKSIKGALEMIDVEHTSNVLDTYNIIHLISPNDEKIIDDAKEYHCPVVVSALYTEDDPSASYIEEVINDKGKASFLKPKALKFLNKADLVLVPCEANIDFLKFNGVTTPIKVVQPGLNMSRFDYSREDEKEIFFRYFREDKNKKLVFAIGEYDVNMNGINSFITAAKKCPNDLFYFFGKMNKTTKLNLKFKRFVKNTPKNVHFISDVPDDVYRSAMLNASVFMIPGYKNAGVISIYEAMAARCQIIARKSAVFKGILDEGITAQVGEFSETLSSLVKDCLDNKIKPTTVKAYEIASELTLTKFGNELKDIYMDLITSMKGDHHDRY